MTEQNSSLQGYILLINELRRAHKTKEVARKLHGDRNWKYWYAPEQAIDEKEFINDPQKSQLLKDAVDSTLVSLSERGAKDARRANALRLRFGLNSNKIRTLSKVGKEIQSLKGSGGISKDVARVLIDNAVRILRNPNIAPELSPYIFPISTGFRVGGPGLEPGTGSV
jgi:hypothetical protein